MSSAAIHDVESNLSYYIDLIETGGEDRIVIMCGNKPAAMLVPYEHSGVSKRIGVAKGKLKVPEDIDKHNDEVATLFNQSEL